MPVPRRNGFVALVSVVVLGAIGLSLAISLPLLGVGNLRTSFSLEQSSQANALVHACAERALEKLRESTTYTGGETLAFGQGACTILTVSGMSNVNRVIQASSTVGTVTRKVKVVVPQVTPTMQISSWQEVADLP